MALNMALVHEKLTQVMNQLETDLEQEMQAYDPEATGNQGLIQLQKGFQEWTLAGQLQTQTLNTLKEGFKSVLQNLRS